MGFADLEMGNLSAFAASVERLAKVFTQNVLKCNQRLVPTVKWSKPYGFPDTMKFTLKSVITLASATTLLVAFTSCSDDASVDEEVVASPSATTQSSDAPSPILAPIESSLVNAEAESISVSEVAEAPYVAFYYSAHWCPPCRLFTPKLVEFYKANGGGERFEIVFVSSDRSEADMYGYMKEEQMPWLAVNFSAIDSSNIKQHAGAYIPWLVVFDRDGNQVANTDYDNGVDPAKVLEQLGDMI